MSSKSTALATTGVEQETEMARQIISMHHDIEADAQRLQTFAQRVVVCGWCLNELKRKVGHGKWMKFFADNLDAKGLSLRTADQYMQIGSVAMRRLEQTSNSQHVANLKQLPALSTTCESESALKKIYTSAGNAISEMTDATTWRQLMLDFGLIRKSKDKGGPTTSGNDPEPFKLKGEARKRRAAELWWNDERLAELHDEAINKKSWQYLSLETLRGIAAIFATVTRDLDDVLKSKKG
ncbi:MAG: hypothetical protein V2A34_02575 [Lentisphaerota bacterium]